jgi:hypothetical protein
MLSLACLNSSRGHIRSTSHLLPPAVYYVFQQWHHSYQLNMLLRKSLKLDYVKVCIFFIISLNFQSKTLPFFLSYAVTKQWRRYTYLSSHYLLKKILYFIHLVLESSWARLKVAFFKICFWPTSLMNSDCKRRLLLENARGSPRRFSGVLPVLRKT